MMPTIQTHRATRSTRLQLLFRNIKSHKPFYLFISPFFLLFTIFGLYPLLFSLYLSFHRWDALTDPTWVGLENFRTLFQDKLFYTALWNTFLLGLYHIPPMVILAFLFALLLNQQWLKMRAVWRAAVFLPVITPMVVVAIVFSLLFGTEFGLINNTLAQALDLFGIKSIDVPWLQSEDWSKITVSILLVWRWTGYNMVIFLAGLQGIDRSVYEAACVDGASRWQQMRLLTIPMMRPTIMFVIIMSLIGTVFMFDEVFVLTDGGPGVSSTNFGLYLFYESFGSFRFGYASAAAYAVAATVFVMTLLILRIGKNPSE